MAIDKRYRRQKNLENQYKKIRKAENVWQQNCNEIDRCIGGQDRLKKYLTHSKETNTRETHRIDPVGTQNQKDYYEELLTKTGKFQKPTLPGQKHKPNKNHLQQQKYWEPYIV